VFSFGVIGCTKKAANSQEAIQQAQELKTPEEQAKYLISQANAFINSKEFDQGIKTAQYVISNLDRNSQEAQSIIEKAKEELKKAAQGALDEARNKIANF